jgi:PDZ domain
MGNREFDTQVVCHDARFAKISENFVLLRMSHMRGVNIALFDCDYNENWMGVFLDADGRIYARYGSVDPETRESHNTVDGLLHTMEAVLDIHKKETVKPQPAFKPPPPVRPEDIPAMDPNVKKFSCIECHMVQTAKFAQLRKEGNRKRDSLWTYPPPDNIGVKLDHQRGNVIREVVPNSFAATAGLRVGDTLVRANGARVLSCADLRFVLNKLEARSRLTFDVEREGTPVKAELALDGDWRRTSPIRQRSFNNYLREKTAFPRWIFHPLNAAEKEKLGIPRENLAIRLLAHKNTTVPGGSLKGAFEDAGFRDNDVIVAFDGDRQDHYPRMPQYFLYIEHDSGDKVEVLFLRDEKEKKTTLVVP